MLDFILLIFQQFFNFFAYLDSIEIIGSLTFFRILLISGLLLIIFRFIGGRDSD